jgi:hypothetical protein
METTEKKAWTASRTRKLFSVRRPKVPVSK